MMNIKVTIVWGSRFCFMILSISEDYIALNGCNQWEGMWKEAVVSYYKVVFRHLLGGRPRTAEAGNSIRVTTMTLLNQFGRSAVYR
jgi:hypothetical protein